MSARPPIRSNPNVIIIITDQQRADVSAREGFPLDTTPFLDALARQGTWFNRDHTSFPVCTPARVSMLTERFPSATRVCTNHNEEDAFYETDLFDMLQAQGYRTAICGKNHSHLTPERIGYFFNLGHHGGFGDDRLEEEQAFDAYLAGLQHRADFKPAPFGVEV